MSVRVIILSSHPSESLEVERIRSMFPDSSYQIDVRKIEDDHEFDPEYALYRSALESSGDSTYTLFIKDTAATNLSPQTILETLQEIINHDSDDQTFDLCYLGKWLDRCDKYEKLWDFNQRGFAVYDTFAPHGTLAILFSPRGTKKFLTIEPVKKNTFPLGYILHSRIIHRRNACATEVNHNSKFVAITPQPSLFVFNLDYATNDFDYLKLAQCVDISEAVKPEKVNGNISFFIFAVIAVVIGIAIFLLVQYGTYITSHVDAMKSCPVHGR